MASSYSYPSQHPHMPVIAIPNVEYSDMKSTSQCYSKISDEVERILMSSEGRQAQRAASSSVFDGSPQTGHSMAIGSDCNNFDGGPLTSDEINRLGMLSSSSSSQSMVDNGIVSRDTTTTKSNSAWCSVDSDNLVALTSMLEIHVSNAGHVDLIGEAFSVMEGNPQISASAAIDQWLTRNDRQRSYDTCNNLQILCNGLSAASILISIMTTPSIDRRIVSDDAIESCISLLRQHLYKHVFVALTQTGHLSQYSSDGKDVGDASRKLSSSIYQQKNKQQKLCPEKESTDKRHHSSQQIQTAMKKLYKPILSTIGLLSILIERIQVLVQVIQLDDQPLLSITSSALSTLAVDPAPSPTSNLGFCHLIQISALEIITMIFKRYPRHRTVIIEDLFPLMLKLPTSKKAIRTFPVAGVSSSNASFLLKETVASAANKDSHSSSPTVIQCISALIINLIQCCVVMPLPITENGHDDAQDNQPKPQCRSPPNLTLPPLSSGLKDCRAMCDLITAQMVQRCRGGNSSSRDFRPVVHNIVDDLLLVRIQPDYPAAEMLLLSLCKRLSNDLLRCSSSETNHGNNYSPLSKSNAFEPTYLAMASDVMGKICADIAKNLKHHRDAPLKLTQAQAVGHADNICPNAETSINIKNEDVRCFCGRTGIMDTFMLDCDRCHSWFHGSCVGVTKDNLPQVWICDECTIQLMVVEQTKQLAARRRGVTLDQEDNEDSPSVSETHIFRQLLLNHLTILSNSSHSSLNIQMARECHLAKWIEEFEKLRRTDSNDDDGSSTGSTHDANAATPKSSSDAQALQAAFFSAHFLEQWNNPTNPTVPSPDEKPNPNPNHTRTAQTKHPLSHEGNAKLVMALAATTSDLSKAFPRLLGVSVMLMSDDNISLRKLSVKSLSQAVRVDPQLMIQSTVRRAVARRFSDDAISVREAAVALVGSYILQDPTIADAFHSSLIQRLVDKGVSVKKRTVKIFRDLLLSQPEYKGRASACTKMLARAADPKEDDGVRDLIQDMFRELWFEFNGCQSKMEDGSCINSDKASIIKSNMFANENNIQNGPNSTHNVIPMLPLQSSSRTHKKDTIRAQELKRSQNRSSAIQMIEVVALSGKANFLTTLVKDVLFGLDHSKDAKGKDRSKRKNESKNHCAMLVGALVEELLAFEEKRASLANGKTTKKEEGRQLMAIISTLGVFGEASADLLRQHLDTILPYLKGDNGVSKDDESLIVSSICKMISCIVPLLVKPEIQRLGEAGICNDLERITYNFGSQALGAAVQALAAFAGHKDSENGSPAKLKLMKLASTFYGYIFKYKDIANDIASSKPGLKSNIQRSLSVLGAICRYHDITPDEKSMEIIDSADLDNYPILKPSALNISNLPNACFIIFLRYLEKGDVSTRCATLRAISGLFISRPRTLLTAEHIGVVENVMSSNSPPQLQTEALHCWKDILLAEEKRVESGEAKQKMESKTQITLSKKISGDQDGDATLVGGVLAQHSRRLFEMTTSTSSTIRLATVQLIEHLLRQGLINPMETVPYLLALQGDIGVPEIRSLALKCLIAEGEKRPDMLRQRVCAGVQRAYLFQRIIHPNNKYVTAVVQDEDKRNHKNSPKKNNLMKQAGSNDAECIFGPVFKESIGKNKAQRKGLFKSLLGLFTPNTSYIATEEDQKRNDKLGLATTPKAASSPSFSFRNKTLKKKLEQKSFIDQIPLLSYASQILAHLPYETYLDPLFIIYHISCIIAVQGAQLLDRMSAFLQPHNLSTVDDGDNNAPDAFEKLASVIENPNHPEVTKAMAIMDDTTAFDMRQFSEMCAEATALILLLRLKMFLKKVFAISEEKCIEYNPATQKERLCDKHISLPERMPLFNNKVQSCYDNDNEKTHSKVGFIKLYAEFRQLMRSGGDVSIGTIILSSENNDKQQEAEDGLKRRKKNQLNVSSMKNDKKKRKRKRKNSGDGDDSDEDYVD